MKKLMTGILIFITIVLLISAYFFIIDKSIASSQHIENVNNLTEQQWDTLCNRYPEQPYRQGHVSTTAGRQTNSSFQTIQGGNRSTNNGVEKIVYETSTSFESNMSTNGTVKCPKRSCGEVVSDDFRYCPFCKSPLPRPSDPNNFLRRKVLKKEETLKMFINKEKLDLEERNREVEAKLRKYRNEYVGMSNENEQDDYTRGIFTGFASDGYAVYSTVGMNH